MPQTLSLAREIIHSVAPELMSRPEQMAFRSLGAVYGSVQQRWVVVYSPQAYQRALKTVNKHCLAQNIAEVQVNALARIRPRHHAQEKPGDVNCLIE